MYVLIDGVEYAPVVIKPEVSEDTQLLSALSVRADNGKTVREYLRDVLLSAINSEEKMVLATAVWAADPSIQRDTAHTEATASALVAGLVHAMCGNPSDGVQSALDLNCSPDDNETKAARPLKPGTVIEFREMRATVIEDNGGPYLTVRTDEVSSTSWYWTMGGASCQVVSTPG